jgi:hypothetical protein
MHLDNVADVTPHHNDEHLLVQYKGHFQDGFNSYSEVKAQRCRAKLLQPGLSPYSQAVPPLYALQ